MDIKESAILGLHLDKHWYYRAKAMAVRRLLSGNRYQMVLDVGSGSGFFARELVRHNLAHAAICVDTSYMGDWTEVIAERTIQFLRIPTNEVTADLLLFMDVLEHVDDDVGLLRDYLGKASTGAQVLVTVPAFAFLWSGHDVFLGHKRRYSLQQVEAVVRQSGLIVEHGCYFFASILPLAAGSRLLRRVFHSQDVARSDLREYPPLINTLLLKICELEVTMMSWNRMGGLTACCLARKHG